MCVSPSPSTSWGASITAVFVSHACIQPGFETLDSWLEHLGLLRHKKILLEHGITDTSQILTITDEVGVGQQYMT
jgi:hypothetical protein